MIDALIIGSGFSGLCMAIKLKASGIHNILILEKADQLGGTWRDNTYPGAECDIPSALYSYSFEPYPHWEYKWSHQHQILKYLNHCAEKYDIVKHIHFGQELVAAQWKDEGHWTIKTKQDKIFNTKCFIPAIGQLHHPSIPNFNGLETLSIPNFHSARWNHELNLENKRVGVIGNAASAVQFIPQIAKIASEIVIYQRSANWVLPKQDRLYHNWEKKLVVKFPFLLKLYRLKIWLLGGGLFFLMNNGYGLLRKFYQWRSRVYIRKHFSDKSIQDLLTPNYPFGAKRVLFSDDYYEALAKSNVQIVTGRIESISANQVDTKDQESKPLDVLIFSTGFKTNPFLMNLDIRGKKGQSISEYWKNGPKNYLGVAIHQFPNMFLMYGPNTNLGHNSIIIMSEAQAKYITQSVRLIVEKKVKSIEVKLEIQKTYFTKIQKRLKNMIWASIEDSWYKAKNGSIPNNWPGRTMEYVRRTKKLKTTDYHIN